MTAFSLPVCVAHLPAVHQAVMPNPGSSYQTIVGMQPTPNLALTGNQQSNMGNQMQGMMVQYPPVQSYQVIVTMREAKYQSTYCRYYLVEASIFLCFVAGFCTTTAVPAASVGVLPAGTGSSGRRWGAALLWSSSPQPAHHHEVPQTRNFKESSAQHYYKIQSCY